VEVVVPGKKMSIFQANFQKISIFQAISQRKFNFDLSRQISKKCRFFQTISPNFSFKTKLAIYSCFWANYSISLQKSPLLNILPFLSSLQKSAGTPYTGAYRHKKALLPVHDKI